MVMVSYEGLGMMTFPWKCGEVLYENLTQEMNFGYSRIARYITSYVFFKPVVGNYNLAISLGIVGNAVMKFIPKLMKSLAECAYCCSKTCCKRWPKGCKESIFGKGLTMNNGGFAMG